MCFCLFFKILWCHKVGSSLLASPVNSLVTELLKVVSGIKTFRELYSLGKLLRGEEFNWIRPKTSHPDGQQEVNQVATQMSQESRQEEIMEEIPKLFLIAALLTYNGH